MLTIRRYRDTDGSAVWALNALPHLGATDDRSVPLELQPLTEPPAEFSDLGDIPGAFMAAGGDFFVAELGGIVVGMAGFRSIDRG